MRQKNIKGHFTVTNYLALLCDTINLNIQLSSNISVFKNLSRPFSLHINTMYKILTDVHCGFLSGSDY